MYKQLFIAIIFTFLLIFFNWNVNYVQADSICTIQTLRIGTEWMRYYHKYADDGVEIPDHRKGPWLYAGEVYINQQICQNINIYQNNGDLKSGGGFKGNATGKATDRKAKPKPYIPAKSIDHSNGEIVPGIKSTDIKASDDVLIRRTTGQCIAGITLNNHEAVEFGKDFVGRYGVSLPAFKNANKIVIWIDMNPNKLNTYLESTSLTVSLFNPRYNSLEDAKKKLLGDDDFVLRTSLDIYKLDLIKELNRLSVLKSVQVDLPNQVQQELNFLTKLKVTIDEIGTDLCGAAIPDPIPHG